MLSLHLLVGFYLGKQKLSPTEAKTDQLPPLFSAIPCPDAILTNNTSNSPLKGLSNSCKEPVRNHIVQDIKEDKEPINEQGQGVDNTTRESGVRILNKTDMADRRILVESV